MQIFQSPEGVSEMKSQDARPNATLPAKSPICLKLNSSCLRRTAPQTAESNTRAADALSRKRAGTLPAGIGRISGTANPVRPYPKDDHGVQEKQALPEIPVRKIEPEQAVLPDVEQADEAHDIEALDDETAPEEPQGPQFPGGWKSQHRRNEQNGHVCAIAAVLHLDPETSGRSAQHGPFDQRMPAASHDECMRNLHQSLRKPGVCRLHRRRKKQSKSGQDTAGEEDHKPRGPPGSRRSEERR